MAVSTSRRGRRATAGIIWGWLRERSNGRKYGGLVCEYNGSLPPIKAERQLRESLEELYTNGYDDTCTMDDITIRMDSFTPRKKYGTAVVSLCFVSHYIPVLNPLVRL